MTGENKQNQLAASNENALNRQVEKRPSALVRQGNEIYLPELVEVPKGSDQERQIIDDIVPPEIRGGLNADAASRNRKYNNLQKLLICAGIFLVLFSTICFWPHPVVLAPPQIPNYGLKQKDNTVLFARAKKLAAEEKYNECAQLLSKAAHAAAENSEKLKSNGQLLHLYFSSVWKCNGNFTAAKILAEKICKLDGDTICWHLFKYQFSFPDCLKKTIGDRELELPKDEEISKKIKRILENEFPEFKKSKFYTDNQEYKRVLDLFEAQMDFGVWLYYGTFEDDEKDYGVANREKANDIAKKHDGSIEFVQLRINIIKTILKHGTSCRYYYDGERLWAEKHLRDKLKELEDKKDKLSK